jgi:hypothetical protein
MRQQDEVAKRIVASLDREWLCEDELREALTEALYLHRRIEGWSDEQLDGVRERVLDELICGSSKATSEFAREIRRAYK